MNWFRAVLFCVAMTAMLFSFSAAMGQEYDGAGNLINVPVNVSFAIDWTKLITLLQSPAFWTSVLVLLSLLAKWFPALEGVRAFVNQIVEIFFPKPVPTPEKAAEIYSRSLAKFTDATPAEIEAAISPMTSKMVGATVKSFARSKKDR